MPKKEPQSNGYVPDASNLPTDHYKLAMVRTSRSGFMLTAIIDCEEKVIPLFTSQPIPQDLLEDFWNTHRCSAPTLTDTVGLGGTEEFIYILVMLTQIQV